MKKLILSVMAALLLAACGSQMSEINYYRLPVPAAGATAAGEAVSGGKYILVEPVQVSEYLAGSGIVYQAGGVEYKTAMYNRWAEALSTQLQNSLAGELKNRLPGKMVSTRRLAEPALSVSVQITGFHGRYDGKAVISGEWTISGGKTGIMQKTFEHAVNQEADGYKALVEALYIGWREEAAAIAASITD